MKKISFAVPVFNEEENVEPIYREVLHVMQAELPGYDFEMIFTDNRSSDSTFAILKRLASHDPRIRVLRFSKNFGYQHSILTGLLHSSGDLAIQLDCDMQDPPALVPQFVKKWEEGFEIVYGIRRGRKEAAYINALRKLFYRLINLLSEEYLPPDVGDFRLIDRKVIQALAHFQESRPYLRGTFATIGFNQTGIVYDRDERKRGHSKFPMKAMVSLAVDGILNHSVLPLRIASYAGMVLTCLTIMGIGIYSVLRLFFHSEWPGGFTTLAVLELFSISINALFLGIIGEYIGRIYKQLKKGPMVIIDERVNI